MNDKIMKLIKNLQFQNHRSDLSEIIIAKSLTITQNARYNFKNETYFAILKSLFTLPESRLALGLLAIVFFAFGFHIYGETQSIIANIYYPIGGYYE